MLFIRVLPNSADSYEWLIWQDNTNNTNEPHQSSLSEIPIAKNIHEIVLLIPGIETVSTQVNIAPTSYANLQKAIPNLLEENFAEDRDALHFAFTKNPTRQNYDVCVINKNFIANLQSQSRTANIAANKMMPEFLALPWSSNTWTVLITDDTILVRTDLNSGFTCEYDFLSTLGQYYSECFDDQKPAAINIINTTSNDITISSIPEGILQINNQNESLMSILAKGLTTAPSDLNLLQGEFRTSHQLQWRKINKVWLASAAFTVASILLLLIGYSMSYFYLAHDKKKLHAEITSLYSEVAPNAMDITDPQPFIAEKIQQLAMEESDHGALLLLGGLGSALQQLHSITLQNFSYDNGHLTATLNSHNMQEIQKLKAMLVENNLQVQSATIKRIANGVTMNISIKEAS